MAKKILEGAIDEHILAINELTADAWELNRVDPQKALLFSEKSLALSEKHEYPLGIACSHRTISICKTWLSELNEALEHANEALAMFEALEDIEHQAQTLHILGTIYYYMPDFEHSFKSFLQSSNLYQSIGHTYGEINANNGLGSVYISIGAYDKAFEVLHHALSISEKTGDREIRPKILEGLGQIYAHREAYPQAINHYQQCYEITLESGDKGGQAYALSGIGECYNKMLDYDQAFKYYTKSLEICRAVDFRIGEANALLSISKLLIRKAEYEDAFKDASKALEIGEQLGNKKVICQCHEVFSEYYEHTNDTQKFVTHYKEFHRLNDEVYKEQTLQHLLSKVLDELPEKVFLKDKSGKFILVNKATAQAYHKNADDLVGTSDFDFFHEKDAQAYRKEELQIMESIKPKYFPEEIFKDPTGQHKILQTVKKPFYIHHLNEVGILGIQYDITEVKELEKKIKKTNKELVRQKKEIEQSYQNIKLLNEIGQNIIASLSIEKINETVYKQVNSLMDASCFGIAIFNEKEKRLDFPGFIEYGEKLPLNFDRLDDPNSLSVWCFRNAEEVFINDITIEHNRYIPEYQGAVIGEQTNSVIYVPLIGKQNAIGVITVQSAYKKAYSERDLDMLKNIANYTSIALENARMYEEMEGKVKERTRKVVEQKEEIEKAYHNLELFNQIGQDITSTLSVHEIIHKVYKKVNRNMDASIFGIGIVNWEKGVIDVPGIYEKGKKLPPHVQQLKDKDRLGVWCVKQMDTVFINDYQKEFNRYFPDVSIPKPAQGELPESVVYIPLIVKEEAIGFLTVQSFNKKAYRKNHLYLLKNLGVQLAIALDNAKLYGNLEEKVKMRTADMERSYKNVKLLSEIGQNIIASLSIEKINETVYEQVNALMDASCFGIAIVNMKEQRLDFPGFIENGDKLPLNWDYLDDKNCLSVVSFLGLREIAINDYNKEYTNYIPEYKGTIIGENTNSVIYLPLVSKKKPIGVITVQSAEKNAYTEQDLNMLRNIANYTSIALENARMYEGLEDKVRERTEEVVQQKEEIENTYKNVKLLSEIGQEITATLSIEKIIERVYANINNLMDASVFGIGIKNEAENRIDFPGAIEKGEVLPFHFHTLDENDKLPVICFNRAESIVINDLEKEAQKYTGKPPEILRGEMVYSLIYMPLILKDKVIGVLTVQSFNLNSYSDHDVNILENLAIYIAIAIDNASAYKTIKTAREKIKQFADRLDIVNAIDKAILKSETLTQLVQQALSLLIDRFGLARANILMFSLENQTYQICSLDPDMSGGIHVSSERPLPEINGLKKLKTDDHYLVKNLQRKRKPAGIEEIYYREKIQSYMLYPLMAKNQLLGCLAVGSDDVDMFTWDLVSIFTEISGGIGAALYQNQLQDEIRIHVNQLEEKNQSITQSIRYAKRIQDAILVSQTYFNSMLPQNFIFFQPRDIVSGDFYWAYETPDNKAIWAVADCTGHGVPGAFMSMIGHSLLNEIIIEKGITAPDIILNELRKEIINSLGQTGAEGETKDGMDIALCTLDKDNRSIQYAGAYNPLYLVRNGELIEIKGDRQPIGYIRGNLGSFTKHELTIMKGDLIYLFSDGYIDQFGGSQGKKFKSRNFRELLQSLYGETMTNQKKILETVLSKWRGDQQQVDDICVVGVKV